MAEAAPSRCVGVEDVWEQKKAALARYYVKDWIERHGAPQFETDLWFVVTDGSGTKTRVPACRAVLNINCHFLHSFQAGDDIEIPQTICTDALAVVYLLWLNYPQFNSPNRFDLLVENVQSKGTVDLAHLYLAITELAKLAHWILCDATITRLKDIMDNSLARVPRVKATKYLYMAAFALSDAQNKNGTRYLQDHDVDSVAEFPAVFISMNEAERDRIADHVVPMFEAFLGDCSRHALSNSTQGGVPRIYKQELSQLFGLTRFLLDSYKEARSGPASS